MTAGDRLNRIITTYDTRLKTAEDETLRRIYSALDEAYFRLEKDLTRSYQRHSENKSLIPSQRKLLVLDEAKLYLTLIDPAKSDRYITAFQGLISTASKLGIDISSQMAQAITNEKLDKFASIPIEAVRAQAEGGMKRLSRHTQDFASRASGVVEMGLVQGWGSQRVASVLRNELGATKGKAETIARTESMSAYNTAAQQNYKENGLNLIQVFATVDGRVCPVCSARNQKIYKLGEILIPLHPRCRCYGVGIKREFLEEGLIDAQWSERFREDSIAQMRLATGKNPDKGLSPFEKYAGLSSPPQSFWEPGQRLPQPPPPPKPVRTPPVAPTPTPPKKAKKQPPPSEFDRGDFSFQGKINKVALKPKKAPDFSTIKDVDLGQLPLLNAPPGMAVSTGVLVVEPDGRIWLVAPTNQFGGYENTFPKGRLEPNLTEQQNALKELYEEAGLTAKITGYVGDFQGSTSLTRYFVAQRTGGHPGDVHWETEKVRLVSPAEARKLLNVKRDRDILDAFLNPKPSPAPKPSQDFPDTLNDLEVLRTLGGSTGAQLVRDKITDKRYVLKRGNSPEHLREEYIADEAYRALGVPVPKVKLYDDGVNPPTKLAEFIEGESLRAVLRAGGDRADRVRKAIQKDFAADALLGNWDVVGMDLDNILVARDGTAYRIDNGGSLRFRAQGQSKGAAWNKYPLELYSLRNPGINDQTASVFGALEHHEIMDQVRRIAQKRSDLLKAVPQELQQSLGDRLDELTRLAEISQTLETDRWKEEYISNFTQNILQIRAAGISDRFPKKLQQDARRLAVELYDENGKKFDDLRGVGSTMYAVRDYINQIGGSYSIIEKWMSEQANDSWNDTPVMVKKFMSQQREKPSDDYYWRGQTQTSSQKKLEENRKRNGDSFETTFTAWHAFNYELLSAIDLPNKNADNTITLMRTEDINVIQGMYGFQPGDSGVTMKRGAIESTSLVESVEVYGTEMTVQRVPIHRIFGAYFVERIPGSSLCPFLMDGENEILAMLDDIPFDYALPGTF